MIGVGIIGAKGYAAGEAMRWIAAHPEFRLARLMARVDSPEPVEKHFPALRRAVGVPIEPMNLESLPRDCAAVILAVPHTTSQEYAPALTAMGLKVVDLSADFRFDTVEAFEETYGLKHKAPELNGRFVYALPELYGPELAKAEAIACPGCYPTASILGLAPLMKRPGTADLSRIVINALSGVSGAGRKVEERYLFVECNESAEAYGVGKHRHRPEIEEKLAKLAGGAVRVTFTPHLVPLNRGILATMTIPMKDQATEAEVLGWYREFYANAPFVRVLPAGVFPGIAAVAGTNYCDIGVAVDRRAGTIIAGSAIDNLAKGTSSQAVQAMNLMFGFPETMGLTTKEASRSGFDPPPAG